MRQGGRGERGATKAEINRSRSIKEDSFGLDALEYETIKSNGNLLAREWKVLG